MEKTKFINYCPDNKFAKFQKRFSSTNKYSVKPGTISMFIGGSGSGKTSAIMQFLLNPRYKLQYDGIILLAPESTLGEEVYLNLKEYFNDIMNDMVEDGVITSEQVEDYYPIKEVSDPDEFELNEYPMNLEKNYMCIMDDILAFPPKKRKTIMDIAIRGRKAGFTTFIAVQSYFDIDRLVRRQASYYFIWKSKESGNINRLKSIIGFSDAVLDVINNRFKNPSDFVLIDKITQAERLRERIGLEAPIKKINHYF